MKENKETISLDFVNSSETLASAKKETKTKETLSKNLINNNDESIAKNTSNVNKNELEIISKDITPLEPSIEGLNEICYNLEHNFRFGDIYIFFDIDLNKNCIINYNANDKFEVFKYIDKQALKPSLQSMLKTRMRAKQIQNFDLDKHSIDKILNSVQGVKKAFDRNKPNFYEDSDYLPTLNMFKQTPLLQYEVKEKISFVQLKEILTTKFKRLSLVIDNVLGKELKGQKWFFDWVSMDINQPLDIKTTMVLIGEQGSGKSIILEEFFKENIYDVSNVSVLDNKSIKDNFNDIYNFKSFVIMNEISTMDLKESNQISQDLKRLITDGTYINRGMFKSGVEKTKTFNIAFATNKNVPLQVENGDRRFSIFGRSLKLLENEEIKNFLDENNEDFGVYINKVKQEIKEFLYFVKALDYDSNVAIQPLENDIKRKIIEQSNKKDDLLITYFNTKDYSKLSKFLKTFEWPNEEEFFTKFKYMWDCGIFDNRTLFEIYVTIYDIQLDKFNKSNIEKRSGFFWGKLLEKPHNPQIKMGLDNINVKVFDSSNFDIKKEQIKHILLGNYDEISKYEINQSLINFDDDTNINDDDINFLENQLESNEDDLKECPF